MGSLFLTLWRYIMKPEVSIYLGSGRQQRGHTIHISTDSATYRLNGSGGRSSKNPAYRRHYYLLMFANSSTSTKKIINNKNWKKNHTKNVTYYMLHDHVTCQILDFTCHLSCVPTCVTSHVSPVMCHQSCVTCNVSPVMCHLSCVPCHVSPVTCHLWHVKRVAPPLGQSWGQTGSCKYLWPLSVLAPKELTLYNLHCTEILSTLHWNTLNPTLQFKSVVFLLY